MKFLTPSLAQWLNGMSYTVNSLLIPIQLCGGKKTKHSRYNVVSRVFLSFSLVLMRFPITVIMESAWFSVILKDLYSTISKCNWLVFVLTSGDFAEQLALSKFRLLLSLHSSRKREQWTEWVLFSFLARKGSTRGSTALCGMHIQTPCTVGFKERERKMREGSALKYSWEAFRILYSHE